MVSPTVVPKVKQENYRKIVSKANSPETLTNSDIEKGLSKFKDPWRPVDANFISKFGAIEENFAMGVRVSRPKKVFNAQSSRSNLAQAGKENVRPPTMRSNQGTDLKVVHHHHVQNFKMNAPLSSPKNVVLVPSSNSTSLTQADRQIASAHLMRSKQAELEAVPHRHVQNSKMNNSHSKPAKEVQDQNHSGNTFCVVTETTKNASGVPVEGSSKVTNTQTSSMPEVGVGDSSKPKKSRGRTQGYKLAKTMLQPFEIIFPQHVNRPVGEHSNKFTTEVGVLVRQFAPLQAESWSVVSQEIKNSIMDRLRENFLFGHEDEVIASVNCIMARRYYTWRYSIHDEFLKYRTLAGALSNPPPMDLDFKDWMYLCNLFSTPKFKAQSERNRKNRAKLRSAHVAGTKAYSKIRYNKRNTITQEDLEFTELYETTHRRRSDKSWVDENAKEFHESMKKHKMMAQLEGRNLTDEQLSVLTFGSKAGYLCGLGHGPKPTSSVTGKRTRAELVREAYEANKRADFAEKLAFVLAEKLKIVEDQQEQLREDINMQFALFREHIFSNSSASNDS